MYNHICRNIAETLSTRDISVHYGVQYSLVRVIVAFYIYIICVATLNIQLEFMDYGTETKKHCARKIREHRI